MTTKVLVQGAHMLQINNDYTHGDRVMKVRHVRPNSGMIVRSGRPIRFPFLKQGSLLVGCLLASKAREHQLPGRGPCRGLNRVSSLSRI
jgi:hypothetical protein